MNQQLADAFPVYSAHHEPGCTWSGLREMSRMQTKTIRAEPRRARSAAQFKPLMVFPNSLILMKLKLTQNSDLLK